MNKEPETIVDIAMRLADSLSPEQRTDLLNVLIECRALGASINSLSPLYCAVYMKEGEITDKDIEWGVTTIQRYESNFKRHSKYLK